jgi:hypothetical protein
MPHPPPPPRVEMKRLGSPRAVVNVDVPARQHSGSACLGRLARSAADLSGLAPNPPSWFRPYTMSHSAAARSMRLAVEQLI